MTKKILLINGDGIGIEIISVAKKIIDFLSNNSNKKFETDYALLGGEAYDKTNSPFPLETILKAKQSDAILLGAVGGPKWDDLNYEYRPERGLLGIRKELQLFANLRPAIVFNSLVESSSLKREIVENLDILIVRELTGGIYFGEPRGKRVLEDGSMDAYNTLIYNSKEVERIARVAFSISKERNKKLCSVDKANVLESTEMWRHKVKEISKEYSEVELSNMYVDNASMQLVRNPKQFDVIVTSNMFGDILSDTAAMLTGSLGMLPSASLGEKSKDGRQYAVYEPVHGSAPDIAGQDIANPIATILSLSMMLKYSFNYLYESEIIETAVRNVLDKGYRTKDIFASPNNITISTSQMGNEVIKEIAKLLK